MNYLFFIGTGPEFIVDALVGRNRRSLESDGPVEAFLGRGGDVSTNTHPHRSHLPTFLVTWTSDSRDPRLAEVGFLQSY